MKARHKSYTSVITQKNHVCEDAVYVWKNNSSKMQPKSPECRHAKCLIMREGKEVWLCKAHFAKECDKLQETLREDTDLRPWYGKMELVIYE